MQGSLAADFQYAGYYAHLPSGLNIAVRRAYNPTLARWISRDPLKEHAGTNLYAYVHGEPTGFIDPNGTNGIGNPAIPYPGPILPPGINPGWIVPGLIIDPELIIPLIFLGGGLVWLYNLNPNNSNSNAKESTKTKCDLDDEIKKCNDKYRKERENCRENFPPGSSQRKGCEDSAEQRRDECLEQAGAL